ncbi:hypothetical protein [Streptomyces chrestomyceticus]|uniref:hypothetical protein n=1 Tax=Streptomyces chrestomyceticus TaxID=68185 RepID=UPI0019CF6F02|nr:hypothetical protein [Streptomyces chrestomyceticus]
MRPELEQRFAAALPEGERYVGILPVGRSMNSPSGKEGCDAPQAKRPVVLSDAAPVRGDRRGRLGSLLLRLGLNDLPSSSTARTENDPALRRKRQQRKKPFFGGWDSLAGQWLAAAQPRSEVGVLTYAVLTEQTFQFVYAQVPRSGGEITGVMELGASFDRSAIAWTRLHDKQFFDYMYGFTDGSWGVASGPDEEYFRRFFPGALTEKDPIP